MSKSQMLRVLVNARLTTAAEEIFALFERTIAEFEEELHRCKEENQRKQERALDSVLRTAESPRPCLDQGLDRGRDLEIPKTPRMKEEPEEQCIIVPDEEESVYVSSVCGEEESFDTDIEEDWRAPFRCSGAQMGADGSSSALNRFWSEGETSVTVNNRDMTEAAKRAEEKQHECSVCKKTFQNKHNLKVHHRVHTGDRPFRCTVCGKGFIVRSTLKLHMRTHTGERPFRCTFCDKTYIQSSHLDAHIRVHTGDRPFSCSLCGKTFIQSTHLKVHMKTHMKKELTAVQTERMASVDTKEHFELVVSRLPVLR